jgi:hypothetical protein
MNSPFCPLNSTGAIVFKLSNAWSIKTSYLSGITCGRADENEGTDGNPTPENMG